MARTFKLHRLGLLCCPVCSKENGLLRTDEQVYGRYWCFSCGATLQSMQPTTKRPRHWQQVPVPATHRDQSIDYRAKIRALRSALEEARQ